jgi:arylsulfatase A-like enzyme
LHMLHPHSPYVPPPEIARLFQVEQSELASSTQKLLEMDAKGILLSPAEREQLVTLYDAEIRRLDGLFGRFIDHLKKLNIYDESLIIFLSDHGEAFQEHERWGHGTTLYQEVIHVPFIIKFPFSFKRNGIVISSYVQTMDLMPTVLEFLNLPKPESFQGQNLLPLIKGQAADRAIFSEILSGDMLAILKQGWKYIYSGKARREEIYDLRVDRGETSDSSSAHPELLQMFRRERSSFFNRNRGWRKKYIGHDSGEHIVLDGNQIEELRTLGYVQ